MRSHSEGEFHLPFVKLGFSLEAEELPSGEFLGFLIRGAIINSLLNLRCIFGKPCDICSRAMWKPFESIGEMSNPGTMWYLEVGKKYPNDYGDKELHFSIGFLGRYVFAYPYFVHAVLRWAKMGIFSKEKRKRIKVKKIEIKDLLRGREFNPRDDFPEVRNLFSFVGEEREEISSNLIQIEFISPFISKQDGKFVGEGEFNFLLFFSAVMRRIISEVRSWEECGFLSSEVSSSQHQTEKIIDIYKKLRERAKDVKTERKNLKKVMLRKPSERQRKLIKMNGIMGSATFSFEDRNSAQKFLSWLLIGQEIGAGKGVRLGLGRYIIHTSLTEEKLLP